MISIKLRTGKSLKVNEGIKVCGPGGCCTRSDGLVV